MAWYDYYIETRPGVQGGAPVVKGTRTPVRTIVVLYTRTYPGDKDRVRAALPHLTPEQIDAAIAYFDEHTAEIDLDIKRHHMALEEFRQAS